MQVVEQGTAAFQILKCDLMPNESIIVEPGVMASQDVGIVPDTSVNGSFIKALLLKFLGGESFFINEYFNKSSKPQSLYISQSVPGDIQVIDINNEEIFLESGSFIARTQGVKTHLRWAGLASFIAGEGLFKLSFTGQGRLWFGCYGAVVEKEIVGDYIVDSGHLLLWPSTVQLELKLAGGLISSFLSKEGFVLKLKGHGKIKLQTRSVKGLAAWLNARFWR